MNLQSLAIYLELFLITQGVLCNLLILYFLPYDVKILFSLNSNTTAILQFCGMDI